MNGGVDGDAKRVEELLRVNAGLAAEVRSLTLGRTDAPRSAPMPTSRRLGALIDERDTLEQQLAESRASLAAVKADRDGLEHQNQEMAEELERLSIGFAGALRRLRGRLFSGRQAAA